MPVLLANGARPVYRADLRRRLGVLVALSAHCRRSRVQKRPSAPPCGAGLCARSAGRFLGVQRYHHVSTDMRPIVNTLFATSVGNLGAMMHLLRGSKETTKNSRPQENPPTFASAPRARPWRQHLRRDRPYVLIMSWQTQSESGQRLNHHR